jgi:hypothetical protein
MKKKFYQTEEFKTLEKEWANKLKKAGFVDIETLASRKHNTIERQKIKVDRAQVIYNQKCILHLNSGLIVDEIDHFIFEKHCDGISNIKISDLLKIHKIKRLSPRAVDLRLVRILKNAGIEPIKFNF